MAADDPGWPGGKAAEDGTMVPAGTDPAGDADSPARHQPATTASQYRLKRFREEHPDVEIVAYGLGLLGLSWADSDGMTRPVRRQLSWSWDASFCDDV